MAEPRHLENAPIVEAIIDVRVALPDGFPAEALYSAKDLLASDFPGLRTQFEFESKFQVVPNDIQAGEIRNKGIKGYMFVSPDEKDLVQFRLNGYTRNRLAPYRKWEELLPSAMELWTAYHDLTSPVELSRVATRYINRFSVPALTTDFSEYLEMPPSIPENIPNVISEFAYRAVLHDTDSGCSAVFTQKIEPDINADRTAVIVDIDAFKQSDIEFGDIEATLNDLHELKNRIFFNTLTEKTLGMFE
ncbi:MAG: TIGR04255 family protein [Bacteroidales bacterium]|nr:TIGR04255 family protein [Candidatus Latescibacterota bacterium]